jgi:DNA repair protein RadC
MTIFEPVITYEKKNIPAIKIEGVNTLVPHLREFFALNVTDPTREYCVLVVLNSKNYIIATKILTVGTVNQTLVSTKDVLRQILLCGGTAFIICHNHPSGDPSPSSADLRVTNSLREASKIIDIAFHDHIVLGEVENDPKGAGYYSFKEGGYV